MYDTKNFFKRGATVDPQGPTAGFDRVIRGGDWTSGSGGSPDIGYLRSAGRSYWLPWEWLDGIGFRVVLAPVHP